MVVFYCANLQETKWVWNYCSPLFQHNVKLLFFKVSETFITPFWQRAVQIGSLSFDSKESTTQMCFFCSFFLPDFIICVNIYKIILHTWLFRFSGPLNCTCHQCRKAFWKLKTFSQSIHPELVTPPWYRTCDCSTKMLTYERNYLKILVQPTKWLPL